MSRWSARIYEYLKSSCKIYIIFMRVVRFYFRVCDSIAVRGRGLLTSTGERRVRRLRMNRTNNLIAPRLNSFLWCINIFPILLPSLDYVYNFVSTIPYMFVFLNNVLSFFTLSLFLEFILFRFRLDLLILYSFVSLFSRANTRCIWRLV